MENNEFIILDKLKKFDLIVSRLLKNFPRHERYCHAKDIRNSINKALHLIIELNKKYFKKTSLTELDVEIGYLQHLIRKSFELKYINEQRYEELSMILTEEGRMIGAWIGKVLKEK